MFLILILLNTLPPYIFHGVNVSFQKIYIARSKTKIVFRQKKKCSRYCINVYTPIQFESRKWNLVPYQSFLTLLMYFYLILLCEKRKYQHIPRFKLGFVYLPRLKAIFRSRAFIAKGYFRSLGFFPP